MEYFIKYTPYFFVISLEAILNFKIFFADGFGLTAPNHWESMGGGGGGGHKTSKKTAL